MTRNLSRKSGCASRPMPTSCQARVSPNLLAACVQGSPGALVVGSRWALRPEGVGPGQPWVDVQGEGLTWESSGMERMRSANDLERRLSLSVLDGRSSGWL